MISKLWEKVRISKDVPIVAITVANSSKCFVCFLDLYMSCVKKIKYMVDTKLTDMPLLWTALSVILSIQLWIQKLYTHCWHDSSLSSLHLTVFTYVNWPEEAWKWGVWVSFTGLCLIFRYIFVIFPVILLVYYDMFYFIDLSFFYSMTCVTCNVS